MCKEFTICNAKMLTGVCLSGLHQLQGKGCNVPDAKWETALDECIAAVEEVRKINSCSHSTINFFTKFCVNCEENIVKYSDESIPVNHDAIGLYKAIELGKNSLNAINLEDERIEALLEHRKDI